MYSQNLRKPSRSRIPLSKQLDDTEPGYYAVVRVFLPGKYPSAGLVTPYFRVSIPEKDWENIRGSLNSSQAIVVYFDGDGWSLHLDEHDLFAVRYQGNDYGVVYYYDDPEAMFLTPKEWDEGIRAMKAANEKSQAADDPQQKNLPF